LSTIWFQAFKTHLSRISFRLASISRTWSFRVINFTSMWISWLIWFDWMTFYLLLFYEINNAITSMILLNSSDMGYLNTVDCFVQQLIWMQASLVSFGLKNWSDIRIFTKKRFTLTNVFSNSGFFVLPLGLCHTSQPFQAPEEK